ncbi:hypothetical protein HY389_02195 [Candidatus Daviesbacteria bacterium]|nr:hypothetical protein [Candidatus Daviesbacteria bacterium]
MKLLAQDSLQKVFGNITPPEEIRNLTNQGSGAAGLSLFFTRVVQLIYLAAGIIFVFMVIFSALQWITSGGDKEAVGKARARLTYAIIGITILSLTFVILNVLGNILGFQFFQPTGIINSPTP